MMKTSILMALMMVGMLVGCTSSIPLDVTVPDETVTDPPDEQSADGNANESEDPGDLEPEPQDEQEPQDEEDPQDDEDPDPVQDDELESVLDFQVPDVNPNSPRYNEDVSPRDYLGGVSAWYFGHST